LDHDLVWYNPEGFKGALHRLKAFHDRYPNKLGPPRHLMDWLQCYKDGTEPEDRWDDNLLVIIDDGNSRKQNCKAAILTNARDELSWRGG
jgi:hypothetical protein